MIVQMEYTQDEADDIDTVFQRGGSFSRAELSQDASHVAAAYISNITAACKQTAMSGAMRWPWSREAPVAHKSIYRYL